MVQNGGMTVLIREEDKSIVVVGPHDPPLGDTGGLILKCAALGKEVTVVCLSHSIYGSGSIEEQERRLREMAEALGIRNTVRLNEVDTQIKDTVPLRHDLVRVFRRYKADVVVCPSAQNPHPDAVGASYAASYAASHASLEGVLPDIEVHVVQAVYQYPGYAFAMGFKPTVYLDITDVARKKYELLTRFAKEKMPETYEYGASTPPYCKTSPIELVLDRERWWGMASGVKYAEAYDSFWTSHLGVRAVEIR